MPLVFLVYINSLVDAVDCNINMLADDTCLSLTDDNTDITAQNLNNFFVNIQNWAMLLNINFNAGKTKTMIMSSKYNVRHDITFNETILENVKKSLDILI